MSIWAAALAIVGVAAGGFVSVLGKMIYKEVRDARKRPTQLPLRMVNTEARVPDEKHAHVGV
jgi:hypothetical protein